MNEFSNEGRAAVAAYRRVQELLVLLGHANQEFTNAVASMPPGDEQEYFRQLAIPVFSPEVEPDASLVTTGEIHQLIEEEGGPPAAKPSAVKPADSRARHGRATAPRTATTGTLPEEAGSAD